MEENIPIDYSWSKDAACKDPEISNTIFFPDEGVKLDKKLARSICLQCPAIEGCLKHALKYEEFGFWAGYTRRELNALRKKLGIKLVRIDALFVKSQVVDVIRETVFSAKIKGRGRKPKIREILDEDRLSGTGT